MERALAAARHLCGSGLRARRVRIWLVVVTGIVAVLGVQALVPAWQGTHGFSTRLGPGIVLAVFLAALGCEYVDSSLGMGYGTTLTPILLLAGFEPLQVVPCVLLSEMVTGLGAGLMHHRDGNVDWSLALPLTLGATLSVPMATLTVHHLPEAALRCSVGVFSCGLGILALVKVLT